MLFPQQDAIALMQRSSVTVEGEETLLERRALVVNVVPTFMEPRDSQREYRFWVDSATGINLKREEYVNGKLYREQIITSLEFNPTIDPLLFKIQRPRYARELPNPHAAGSN